MRLLGGLPPFLAGTPLPVSQLDSRLVRATLPGYGRGATRAEVAELADPGDSKPLGCQVNASADRDGLALVLMWPVRERRGHIPGRSIEPRRAVHTSYSPLS